MKNLHTYEEFINEASQRGKVIFSVDEETAEHPPEPIEETVFKKGDKIRVKASAMSKFKTDRLGFNNISNPIFTVVSGPKRGYISARRAGKLDDLPVDDVELLSVDEESEDSVIDIVESQINEGTITPMQMMMKGTTLINKISIGAKFEGELDNKPETLTVVGFGDRANAFKIFEVETSDGTKTYLKATVMYGCDYRVMDSPRGNWDTAKGFNLKKITI